MTILNTAWSFAVAYKWYALSIAALLVVGVGFGLSRGGASDQPTDATPTVTVARVADLMSGASSLSTIATITSVSEAKISPESTGKIVRVRATLGDVVAAGHVLAEIENSSQRAAVLQAEGAYDAAKAALRKVQGGTREEQLAILQSSLDGAKRSAVTTLLSAYAAVESAILDDVDVMFENPNNSSRKFLVVTSYSQLTIELQNDRSTLGTILLRQSAQAKNLSASSNLAIELDTSEAELRAVRGYLDTMVRALSGAIPTDSVDATDIATYTSNINAARTSITSSLTAIAAARSALSTAENNLSQGVVGAVSEDVAAAEAAVKQAQGAYNAALANLEKTIIRSPISGTLNNFTVKLGDTVSSQQQVAIVSNNGALEAIAYVTEEDTSRISVGQAVALEGGEKGVVTRIAPALDPVTRRIEVRIGLPAGGSAFLNGQSVRVELAEGKTKPITGPLAIPITALRMEANRTLVFVVENDQLAVREVVIGRLSGDTVQVTDGLTLDTEIVVDARGRTEGESVRVAR